MTTSELAAVEALLFKVLPDPRGFAERVLGELTDRLVGAPPAEGVTVVPGYESTTHAAVVDRTRLLAAALGACVCWGEDAACADCAGEGAAGWLPPDPELYARFVAPAVRRPPTDPRLAHPAGTPGTDPRTDRPTEGEPT